MTFISSEVTECFAHRRAKGKVMGGSKNIFLSEVKCLNYIVFYFVVGLCWLVYFVSWVVYFELYFLRPTFI